MSTRGAVLIAQKGKIKGFYNHSDSYPGGLGEHIIKALKNIEKSKGGWEQFKENCLKVKLVREDAKPSKELQERYVGYSDTGVSTGTLEEWYCLLRNLQGVQYLKEIHKGKVEHMVDSSSFPKDSLFCEYAYVIDLDKMVLEFYKGFQEVPQKGNRFGVKPDKSEHRTTVYYPCAKVGEIHLIGISTDRKTIKTMRELYAKVEEEEVEN